MTNDRTLREGIWNKFNLPGTTCAFGADHIVNLRKGKSNNLIVHLCGGGVSWDSESAKCPGGAEYAVPGKPELYVVKTDQWKNQWEIDGEMHRGLLSRDKSNPFCDWNVAVITYGTGDFHAGSGEYTFTDHLGNEKTLHYRGYDNVMIAMEKIKAEFPDVERLLISGESGGAFAVPGVSRDIIKFYPECEDVTVLADAALLIYNGWPTTTRDLWHSPKHIADATVSDNILLDWFRALYREYGDRIKYLFSCANVDYALASYQNYVNTGVFTHNDEVCAYFKSKLSDMVREFKKLTPRFSVYIHDTGLHCVFSRHEMYLGIQSCGVTPVKWITDAMDGNTYDVGITLLD